MGSAKFASRLRKAKKSACTARRLPLKARALAVRVDSRPNDGATEHTDQKMRSRSESNTTEGQLKPRRGRDKAAKRWGHINKVQFDKVVVDLADDDYFDDEEREAQLRYEAISRVSWVLLTGGRLNADNYAVSIVSQGGEPLRFACSRKSDGRVVEVYQAFDEGDIDERGPFAITFRERDWSAFAAARAFVENVGALRSLDAIEERKNGRKSVPKARSSVVSISP